MVMFPGLRRFLSGFWPPPWRSKARGTTLLFVSSERTLRLDDAGEGACPGEVQDKSAGSGFAHEAPAGCQAGIAWQEFPLACEAPEGLAGMVEAALAAGGPPEAAVWVLYEELELVTLMLPTAQVAGLEEHALKEALRFEVEAAGLAPAGLELAATLAVSEDGMSNFALCLAPPGVVDAVRKAVRKAGSKLAGLGHPAALPRSLSDAQIWQRLEYWPSVTVGVAGAPGGRRWIQVFRSNARRGAVQKDIERWRRSMLASAYPESLNSRAALEMDTESAAAFLLLREDDRQRWLRAWMAVLLAGEASFLPFFRPVDKPLPEPAWVSLFTALALGVCLAHYGWFAHQERVARAETETLKIAEAQMKTMQEAIRKDEDERGKLEQISRMRQENQAAVPEVVFALRQRFAHLLYELASLRGEAVVIEKIASLREGVEVEGVTVDLYEANRMATMLTDRMARLGWRVEQPTHDDLKMFGAGGPWRFIIPVRDSGLAGFAKPARAAETP